MFFYNHKGSDGYYREYVNPLFVRFSHDSDIVNSCVLSDKATPDLFLFDEEYLLFCYFPGINADIANELHITENRLYEIVAGNLVIGSLSLEVQEMEK